MSSICEGIDDLVSVQLETRPLKSDRRVRLIVQAAREAQGGMSEPTAKAVLEALAGRSAAVVSSGWVIPKWFPQGELCGMIGAISLTRFLVVGLRKKVLFPAEEEVLGVAERLCRVAGLRICDWEDFVTSDHPQVCLMAFPKDDESALQRSAEIRDRVSPGVAITVEKCGPAPGGVFHAGNGLDMSASTARVNVLIDDFRAHGITTVGIGDLGNEIGFGGIAGETRKILDEVADCRCGCGEGIVTSCATDHVIVGSSSNRGALALEGALAAMSGRAEFMADGRLTIRLTEEAALAGAMDSFYVSPVPTDGHGLPAPIGGALADMVRFMASSETIEYPLYRARG